MLTSMGYRWNSILKMHYLSRKWSTPRNSLLSLDTKEVLNPTLQTLLKDQRPNRTRDTIMYINGTHPGT